MLKVEHIGIAVKSLSDSIPLFEKLLNSQCYKTEAVESEAVSTAFFQTNETKIELLLSSAAYVKLLLYTKTPKIKMNKRLHEKDLYYMFVAVVERQLET